MLSLLRPMNGTTFLWRMEAITMTQMRRKGLFSLVLSSRSPNFHQSVVDVARISESLL